MALKLSLKVSSRQSRQDETDRTRAADALEPQIGSLREAEPASLFASSKATGHAMRRRTQTRDTTFSQPLYIALGCEAARLRLQFSEWLPTVHGFRRHPEFRLVNMSCLTAYRARVVSRSL
ncbi:hypothetical protein E4U57_001926 [Claviceps arundinis]|uniref:Uncharacterized protein n=1 Tax=Claviceps arundinis TaxID=1623583 RepID=A0ABQ7PBH4_9HYPO|nr:hypothetical protein E4U57_001926 [Claviceps arundinis]